MARKYNFGRVSSVSKLDQETIETVENSLMHPVEAVYKLPPNHYLIDHLGDWLFSGYEKDVKNAFSRLSKKFKFDVDYFAAELLPKSYDAIYDIWLALVCEGTIVAVYNKPEKRVEKVILN